MASKPGTPATLVKEVQVPEWEYEHGATPARRSILPGSLLLSAHIKLDKVLPPNRGYCRMSRRIFLIVLLAVVLALLALIIGLAVGLTQKKSTSSQNLPLPSNSASFTGDLTYYGTGLGACGITSTDSDHIVAVSHILFDAAGSTSQNGGNSNNNPLCNRVIRASRFDTAVGEQRTFDLTVVDRCTGCQENDLDTTIGVFEQMASVDQGRVNVTWAWLSSG